MKTERQTLHSLPLRHTATAAANIDTHTLSLSHHTQFLTPVPVWELKHIRKLSHLCAISYKLSSVTRRALKRKHGLELVVASWVNDAQNAGLLEVCFEACVCVCVIANEQQVGGKSST